MSEHWTVEPMAPPSPASAAVESLRISSGGSAYICVLVPSAAVVLQTAWLRDLSLRRLVGFSTWLADELARDAVGEPAAGWRFDQAVADWTDRVGPANVVVLAGEDAVSEPKTASEVVGQHLDECWPAGTSPRLLDDLEVAVVEGMLAQLEELHHPRPVAPELIRGSADRVRRAASEPGSTTLPGSLTGPVLARTSAMADRVEGIGAHVRGDAAALLWRAPAPQAGGRAEVPLSVAMAFASGVIEHTLSWAEGDAEGLPA